MVTLSALISDLDRELLRLRYKESTMIWYRQCWRRLEGYFSARGVEEFSLEIAIAWVDTSCDFFAKEQAGKLKQTDVYLFRVAQMLGDFVAHSAVLRRYDRRADKLTADQAELIGKFQAGLRAEGCAVSTVRTYGTLAGEFLSFVDTRCRLADCNARTIEAFVATLSGYQAKTVEQKLCAVRSFLRYAGRQGQVDADVLASCRTTKLFTGAICTMHNWMRVSGYTVLMFTASIQNNRSRLGLSVIPG